MADSRSPKLKKKSTLNSNNDTSSSEMEEMFPGPEKTSTLNNIFESGDQELGDQEAKNKADPGVIPEMPEGFGPKTSASKTTRSQQGKTRRTRTTQEKRDPGTLLRSDYKYNSTPTPTSDPDSTDDTPVITATIPQEDQDRFAHISKNLESYLARLDSLQRETEIAAHSDYIDRNKITDMRHEVAEKQRALALLWRGYRFAYNAPANTVTVDAKQESTVTTPFGILHFQENITTTAGKAALLAKGQRIIDYGASGGVTEEINRNLDAMEARLTTPQENRSHAFFTSPRTKHAAPEELICNGSTFDERYGDAITKRNAYLGEPINTALGNIHTNAAVKHTPQCKVRVIPMEVTIKDKQFMTGTPLIAKTATIQINDGHHCRSEFYTIDNSIFDKVKRERSGLTSIPGLANMEWAANNIKSFVAKMKNPRETINLDTGSMSKELTEALIIYCKFKHYKFRAPVGFSVSDKQMELFAKKWAVYDSADKSAAEDLELQVKSTLQRPPRSS